LAAKEGKTQGWVQLKLRFGRFLSFCENNTGRINLNEWRFRKYWERSEGANERGRFRHVVEMIEADEKSGGHSTINPIGGVDAARFRAKLFAPSRGIVNASEAAKGQRPLLLLSSGDDRKLWREKPIAARPPDCVQRVRAALLKHPPPSCSRGLGPPPHAGSIIPCWP